MFRFIFIALLTVILPLCGAENASPRQKTERVKPFKIAVLDFTCIDIQGQKFYQFQPAPPAAQPEESLNAADRFSISRRMQGWVKMLDAQTAKWLNQHETLRSEAENDRAALRRKMLGDKILNSPRRNIVIGAEYLIADLGRYPETMVPVNRANIDRALAEIDFGMEMTSDLKTLSEFNRVSGADYLLYVTVADFQTRERKFKGFGIETNSREYVLDMVYKLVDLHNGDVVASGVVSSIKKELKTPYLEEINSDYFKDLMKNGSAKIAEELNRRIEEITSAKPGNNNAGKP